VDRKAEQVEMSQLQFVLDEEFIFVKPFLTSHAAAAVHTKNKA